MRERLTIRDITLLLRIFYVVSIGCGIVAIGFILGGDVGLGATLLVVLLLTVATFIRFERRFLKPLRDSQKEPRGEG